MTEKPMLTRRALLSGLSIGGAGAVSGLCFSVPALSETPTSKDIAAARQLEGSCRLLPEAVEGPFYFDPDMERSDIRDGRPGLALSLILKIIDGATCSPIEKARVDVWHADARGVYSGYGGQGDDRQLSAKGESYLRGTQFSAADGLVRFTTIYPGWYPGRTPHIHVKVFLDEKTVLTGQIYFPDEMSGRVYQRKAPYSKRPVADTSNKTDWLFNQATKEGGGIVMNVEEKETGIVASLVIAVDKAGRSQAGGLKGWWDRLFKS